MTSPSPHILHHIITPAHHLVSKVKLIIVVIKSLVIFSSFFFRLCFLPFNTCLFVTTWTTFHWHRYPLRVATWDTVEISSGIVSRLFWAVILEAFGEWKRIWTLLTSFSPCTFSLAMLEIGFADVAEVSACDRFSWRLGRANALFSLRMITMFITTIPTFGKMWMKTSQTIV